jgi:hypothetical protein
MRQRGIDKVVMVSGVVEKRSPLPVPRERVRVRVIAIDESRQQFEITLT